ncbi:MAG: tRNA (adenosine(37)-N6)-threonylcarbamoyltransferase complex transferase subunit TsaD [Bacteroidetes bacterium]|nr:tRNA (adenosine(37)-N6)-threonylcarbamoyltransferase complex transferase subunit TsaD [Bacteroidota bacterium]MDA1333367.1 tRNA (adenosine(37)-N6)-threonylcarbamoyltransferase complex transferase subunit TsaD [Bacteroidota bacterium]
MSHQPIILGIETSCDDTAAAVVAGGQLLANSVSTQLEHEKWGGVVPEIASRAHERQIVPVVNDALAKAGIDRADIDAVAVTVGPGLIGSLLVGVSFAKALCLGLDRPLIAVNHLDGHLASLYLAPSPPPWPHLCLIVSGGHTQLMRVDGPGETTLLGRTRDDAAGEAFDKVGKLLGLSYPAGPQVDRLAREGDPTFHAFPRTRLKGYDWSFSGIKTSVLYYLNALPETERSGFAARHLSDLCASFQEAVVDMLVAPVKKAMQDTGIRHVGLVGGVSANTRLRERLGELCTTQRGALYVPPMEYCMDNAAMIAMAGLHRFQSGQTSPLTVSADPSLTLT